MTDTPCRVSTDEINHDLAQMEREKFARPTEVLAQEYITDGKITDEDVIEAIAELSATAKDALVRGLSGDDYEAVGKIVRAAVYNHVYWRFDRGYLEDSQ